ncbi:MAG: glucokinase [Bacteroidota bacterium]|nr:glucokinase [Bacteroidota bacterium]
MIDVQSTAVPIFFRKKLSLLPETVTVLAGDIGATKTNLALFEFNNTEPVILYEAQFHSANFKDVTAILQQFLANQKKPGRISLGVAGPVIDEKAMITNLHWEIDSGRIREKCGIEEVRLINDLEALAYGLAGLGTTDCTTLLKGKKNMPGNIAVIAPGTGLGEAGLYWDGEFYHPFATEGGHCDFAPRCGLDIELYSYLEEKFGHVSWERLVSGPGICNIYEFLRDIKKRKQPRWLEEKLSHGDTAATISQYASKGECPVCNETMTMFLCYLAEESANLALKFKATGGIFIGGGILPKIRYLVDRNIFAGNFCRAGRLQTLLERIPVKIVLNDKTALRGAAFYGAYA